MKTVNEFTKDYKYDKGKPMLNLIPPSAYESLGRVLTYGADKYQPNSWQTVTNAKERYLSALLRHLVEYMKDSGSKDNESGFLHIEHALCNAMFLNHLEKGEANGKK